jgi:hypothetical protein
MPSDLLEKVKRVFIKCQKCEGFGYCSYTIDGKDVFGECPVCHSKCGWWEIKEEKEL